MRYIVNSYSTVYLQIVQDAKYNISCTVVFVIVPGRFLHIVGQNPSDSKSNQLHVDSFQIWLYLLGVYSLNRSVILLQSQTSTGYFSKSTGSSVTNRWSSPSPGL